MEEKIKEVIAQHSDKIESVVEKKVEEVLESKTAEVKAEVDKVEDKIESTLEKTADDIEKKFDQVVPESVKNIVESNLAEIVDGRVISCSLFGFLWTLRITRKDSQSSPSKSEETENKPKSQPALNIRVPV